MVSLLEMSLISQTNKQQKKNGDQTRKTGKSPGDDMHVPHAHVCCLNHFYFSYMEFFFNYFPDIYFYLLLILFYKKNKVIRCNCI